MSDKLKKLFLGVVLLAASAAFFYFQTSSVPHIRALGRVVNGHNRVAMEDIHDLNSTAWNTTAESGSAMGYEAVLQRQPTSSVPGAKQQPLNLSHNDVIVLPFAKYTRPGEELLRQDWTKQLQQFLRGCSRDSPVSVVAANYLYRDVVINWLVVARLKVEPPLENILVISFDSALHELMQSVGIPSIGVFSESMLLRKGDYNFKELFVARVTVLRMINYFGYDVAHYDSDAIIQKNLNPLYSNHSDSDVIGSTGTFPGAVKRKWGFTLCMGAILFRSSPRTELLWETWNKEAVSPDDQVWINFAMLAMNITWDSESVRTMESHGKGERGFKVTALSQLQVCRMGQCHAENADHYYIWHKGGHKTRDSKIKTSSEIGSWYVKSNWETITMEMTAKGVEWLRKIAVHLIDM